MEYKILFYKVISNTGIETILMTRSEAEIVAQIIRGRVVEVRK